MRNAYQRAPPLTSGVVCDHEHVINVEYASPNICLGNIVKKDKLALMLGKHREGRQVDRGSALQSLDITLDIPNQCQQLFQTNVRRQHKCRGHCLFFKLILVSVLSKSDASTSIVVKDILTGGRTSHGRILNDPTTYMHQSGPYFAGTFARPPHDRAPHPTPFRISSRLGLDIHHRLIRDRLQALPWSSGRR